MVVVALVGLTSLVLTVLAALGVCRVLVVASGSMAPSLHPGDLVVSRLVPAGDLRPGQVVTFSDASRSGALITHRVVSVQAHAGRIEVVSRGDANSAEERWDAVPTAHVGLLAARVPAVGRVLPRGGPGGVPTALLGVPLVLAGVWPCAGSGPAPRRRPAAPQQLLAAHRGRRGRAGRPRCVADGRRLLVGGDQRELAVVRRRLLAPAGIGTAASGLDAQVPLSWNSLPWATEYQVQRRTNGSGSWSTTSWAASTSSTVPGSTNNLSYEFQVQARNGGGPSAWSSSVVATPRQWAQVSAGASHSCAVTVSGRAYCWGDDSFGEIGDGTDRRATTGPGSRGHDDGVDGHQRREDRRRLQLHLRGHHGRPGLLLGHQQLRPARRRHVHQPVGADPGGHRHRVDHDERGAASTGTSSTPAQSRPGGGPTARVTTPCGQLGDPASRFSSVTTPVAVDTSTGLTTTNVASLSVGSYHTCAVTTGGQAYCWGDNIWGQLGNTSGAFWQTTPIAVSTGAGLTATRSISAGDDNTCAVSTGGQAYCWGQNFYGEIGDGTNTASNTPVAVATSTGLTATERGPGDRRRVVRLRGLTTAGAVYCWGDDSQGQLGDGATTGQQLPTPAATGTGLDGTNGAGISLGFYHACAVTTITPAGHGGRVYCWGWNSSGVLGDGTTTPRHAPAAIATTPIPSDVPDVPTGLAGANDEDAQVSLTFTGVGGATDYQARWRVGAGAWTTTGVLGRQPPGRARSDRTAPSTSCSCGPTTPPASAPGPASVTATPLGPPPGLYAPSGLETQIPVSWGTEAGATDYQVQLAHQRLRPLDGDRLDDGSTSTTLTGLTNDTTYEVQAQARDANGVSAWSASMLATPRRWASVSTGFDHTCAVTMSWRAYCWGGDDVRPAR